MRTLYHWPLCPFCRTVRLVLGEKRLSYKGVVERVWKEREEFLELNPLGQIPVLVEENGSILADSTALINYLDEAYPDISLIGMTPLQRAEARRLVAYFGDKFNQEVSRKLVFEKTLKRHFGLGYTDSATIREGSQSLKQHLDYLCWLIGRRHWLAGDTYSIADSAAAAHLSCLDYMGHLSWEKYPEIYDWYSRVKSRPAMRDILSDRLPGLMPSAHYQNLDF